MTASSQPAAVDRLADKSRTVLLRADTKAILIATLGGSQQALDVRNVNCAGYGRIWHKPQASEVGWVDFIFPLSQQRTSWDYLLSKSKLLRSSKSQAAITDVGSAS